MSDRYEPFALLWTGTPPTEAELKAITAGVACLDYREGDHPPFDWQGCLDLWRNPDPLRIDPQLLVDILTTLGHPCKAQWAQFKRQPYHWESPHEIDLVADAFEWKEPSGADLLKVKEFHEFTIAYLEAMEAK